MAENDTQPFDDKDVLYRFVPTEEEKETYAQASEYGIAQSQREPGKLLLLIRTWAGWNLPSRQAQIEQPIIARLLTERKEFDGKETALHHAIRDLTTTLAKVEAERDACRGMLMEVLNNCPVCQGEPTCNRHDDWKYVLEEKIP